MKISHSLVTLGLVALLGACGGGGGGGTPAPFAMASTGVFIDSPVGGINFTTATQSGKTNAKGEFSYVVGEYVTFSIGSVQLPPVVANVTVTPLDIAKTTDINNPVVSNILVLLQSLDEDGNPANGITIPATAAAKATTAIDFNVTPALFAANSAVTGLVANSGSVTKTLVTEAAAKAHFQNNTQTNGSTVKLESAESNAILVDYLVLLNSIKNNNYTAAKASNTFKYATSIGARVTGNGILITENEKAFQLQVEQLLSNFLLKLQELSSIYYIDAPFLKLELTKYKNDDLSYLFTIEMSSPQFSLTVSNDYEYAIQKILLYK